MSRLTDDKISEIHQTVAFLLAQTGAPQPIAFAIVFADGDDCACTTNVPNGEHAAVMLTGAAAWCRRNEPTQIRVAQAPEVPQ